MWLVAAVPVSANHEPARLGLTPVGTDGTYFEISLDAGDRRQLRVEAANFGDEPVDARTYAADVYSLVNGGFGVELFGKQPTGTTTWITYPNAEYELGRQDAVVVDFDVEVPTGTPPGEYVTALVIENAEPVRGSGDVAVDQVNRSAIAIAINVPGSSAPALDIGGVRHKSVSGVSLLAFEIHNPGNLHLKPAGEYKLRDEAGREIVASTQVVMDSVYAGTSTTLEIGLPDSLAAGEYCAELTISDLETEATDSTTCLRFSVGQEVAGDLPLGANRLVDTFLGTIRGSPVISAGVALVAAAALAVVFVLTRRRRRDAAADNPHPTAWPAADLGTGGDSPEATAARIAAAMRSALREHPSIARAWIMERESGFVMAIEAARGTTPAEAATLAMKLQERADRAGGLIMPMQVVSIQGAGPVSRMTADAVPFYVRLQEARG